VPGAGLQPQRSFDTVWDAELGYRRLGKITCSCFRSRTRVALNKLFDEY
jgi:hypothetical protein